MHDTMFDAPPATIGSHSEVTPPLKSECKAGPAQGVQGQDWGLVWYCAEWTRTRQPL